MTLLVNIIITWLIEKVLSSSRYQSPESHLCDIVDRLMENAAKLIV